MHLRRSSEGPLHDPVPATAWDELPAKPAHEPVIKAPRAAEVVAPVAPARAA